MSKRKKSVPVQARRAHDPLHVGTIDALTVTRAHMPKFNGHVCRGGFHGTTGYNRKTTKAETRRIIAEG